MDPLFKVFSSLSMNWTGTLSQMCWCRETCKPGASKFQSRRAAEGCCAVYLRCFPAKTHLIQMNESLTVLWRRRWKADGDPFIQVRCVAAEKHLKRFLNICLVSLSYIFTCEIRTCSIGIHSIKTKRCKMWKKNQSYESPESLIRLTDCKKTFK